MYFYKTKLGKIYSSYSSQNCRKIEIYEKKKIFHHMILLIQMNQFCRNLLNFMKAFLRKKKQKYF